MRLKCINCQYTKEVMEQELMNNTECEICGGSMMFEEGADYLLSEKAKEEKIINEQEGLDIVLDKKLIEGMVEDLLKFGENKMWEEINKMDIETRLRVLPIFFEAKRITINNKGV